MKFLTLRHVGEKDEDPGAWMALRQQPGEAFPQWAVYDGDPDKTEEPLLRVRIIPNGLVRETKFRHKVKDETIVTREGIRYSHDDIKDQKVACDLAQYALLDTRLVRVEVPAPLTAQRYGELLGRAVATGAKVDLAGEWARPGLKEFVLDDQKGFAGMVCAAANALKNRDEAEEAGKA